MKSKGIIKEDLYFVERDVENYAGELITKKRMEKIVFKYASGGTRGVYDSEEEIFKTEGGDELCVPLEYIRLEGVR